MNAQDGSAENWLISFTNALRTELPVGKAAECSYHYSMAKHR